MKLIKLIVSVCLFLTVIHDGFSQEENLVKINHAVSFGYPTGPNVSNVGVNIAYNLEMVKKERFSWEGQASVSYFSLPEIRNTYVTSLLFGPRIYVLQSDKKVRWYFSFLPGASLVTEEIYARWSSGGISMLIENNFKLGYSLGSYLQIKDSLILGASYEQTGIMVFKIGYLIPS